MHAPIEGSAAPTSTTIGVAIASYNGIRYIAEQLESIERQTVPPALISVSDDCSSDGTWEFLQEYKQKSSIPMVLNSNARQLGVLENFMLAFHQCHTDYIAYCDQDDVWDPQKIAACRKVLGRGNISLVFHRSTIVDAELRNLGEFSPGNIAGGTYAVPHFPDVLWGFGHQMIFSRQVLGVLDLIRAASSREIRTIADCFDYSLLVAAGFIGDIYFVDQELMKFRRHNQSVSPAGKPLMMQHNAGERDRRANRIRITARTLETVLAELRNGNFMPFNSANLLDKNVEHIQRLATRYAKRAIIYDSGVFWKRLRAFSALLMSGAYGSVHANKLPARQLLLDGGRALLGKLTA